MNLDSFLRKITYQQITSDGLRGLGHDDRDDGRGRGPRRAPQRRDDPAEKPREPIAAQQRPADRDRLRQRLPNTTVCENNDDRHKPWTYAISRENIRTLAPYSTARDEYRGELGISLDANENPYDNGLQPLPRPAARRPQADACRKSRASPVGKIFVGNGSDEPIDLVFRLFCEPRLHNAVSIAPTYGMYKVAAAINDVQMREVQLEPDFSLDADKLLAATDGNTRLLLLCSPNNPTGNCFPHGDRSNGSSARSTASWCSTKRTSTSPAQPGFLLATWTNSRT